MHRVIHVLHIKDHAHTNADLSTGGGRHTCVSLSLRHLFCDNLYMRDIIKLFAYFEEPLRRYVGC